MTGLGYLTMARAVAEIHVVHDGRFIEGNSLPLGHGVERAINVGQMTERKVADEDTLDFVVAHATVHPAQKDGQLRAEGKHNC